MFAFLTKISSFSDSYLSVFLQTNSSLWTVIPYIIEKVNLLPNFDVLVVIGECSNIQDVDLLVLDASSALDAGFSTTTPMYRSAPYKPQHFF